MLTPQNKAHIDQYAQLVHLGAGITWSEFIRLPDAEVEYIIEAFRSLQAQGTGEKP